MLKILELRERAKTELGTRFDLKALHDVILDWRRDAADGEKRGLNDWINDQKNDR